MSEAQVNVTIGAKIDQLITEFQKANNNVHASVSHISDSVKKAMAEVEAASNKAAAAMNKIGQESEENARRTTSSMGMVGEFMKGMMGQLVAGFTLKKITDTVVEFADEAERLGNTAQIVGTTATAISRLHAVAEPMGIAAESVDTGMKKLAKTLVEAQRGGDEAVQAFAAIGIKGEELKHLSLEQVFARISDKFHDTEDGAGKTAAAMMLLGRSGSDLIPMLNKGSEAMTEAADEAQKMGAVMGDDAVAAGTALDESLDKLGLQAKGLKNVMAQALAPAVQFIADTFTDSSGTAMDFGSVFKIVGTIVIGATGVIQQAWVIVSGIVRGITIAIASLVDATMKAAQMDFSGAKAALVQGKEMIGEEIDNIVKGYTGAGARMEKAIGDMWSGAAKGKPDVKGDSSAPKGELEFGDKSGGAEKAAAAAKARAAAEKEAEKDKFEYEMQVLANEMAEQQKGAQHRVEIAQQMTAKVKEQFGEESREYARAKEEEKRVAKEVAEENRRIQDQALGVARDHAQAAIELERAKADYLVATGEMTATQRAQFERNAEDQMYALKLSYLQQRLQLMASEPAEVARINGEIEQLTADHAVRMQTLDTATFDASKQQWDNYFQSITDGFAGTIQGMIFQGQTWQQAFGNLLQNVLGMFINTGVKMLFSHITTETAKTTATVTGAAIRTTAEQAASKQSIMANAGAAIKNIMTKGAEVFANVYNAIAGIPYVGPFLAPVMAVAATGAVIAMVGKVASAEGGWDRVPYDGAQAILHKEEMVLPAPLAEGLRNLVANNQTGGNAGVHIHALDRRDVARYFDDNADQMMRSLRNHTAANPGGF